MAAGLDPAEWMNTGAGRYFVCDDRMRVAEDDPGTPKPPPGWRRARWALEEPLETLLALNLPKLLDDDVSFLFRAGDYWGLQDITGIDPLGRIHLMELKKDKIDRPVTEQLAAYLLRTMFDGRADFVRRMAHFSENGLTDSRWSVYLAGALSNKRTTTVGPKAYHTHIAAQNRGPVLSDHEWRCQSEVERHRRQVETLMAMLADDGLPTMSASSLDAWAQEVRGATLPRSLPSHPVRIRRPGVIWLVGRRIDGAALEQVRLWRRAGVDARPLCVEPRQEPGTGRWMLRVLSEHFPSRRLLVRQVAEGLPDLDEASFREGDGRPVGYELKLSLYAHKAASSRDLGGGGDPLHHGARAYLYGPVAEEPVAIWSPEGRIR